MEHTSVFVKIDQYKQLADLLGAVETKLNESEGMLRQLEKLKSEEDAQLRAWASTLEEVRARSAELHRSLSMRQ